jgi:hypothetical protein
MQFPGRAFLDGGGLYPFRLPLQVIDFWRAWLAGPKILCMAVRVIGGGGPLVR